MSSNLDQIYVGRDGSRNEETSGAEDRQQVIHKSFKESSSHGSPKSSKHIEDIFHFLREKVN